MRFYPRCLSVPVIVATAFLAACSQSPEQIRAGQLQKAITLLRAGDAQACVHPLVIETALAAIGDNIGGSALIGRPTEQHADTWRRMDANIVAASATVEAVNPNSSRVACRADLEAYVGENLRTVPLFYGAQPSADGSDIIVDIISMTAADELFAAAMMSEMMAGFRGPTPPRDEESGAIQRGIAANNAAEAEKAQMQKEASPAQAASPPDVRPEDADPGAHTLEY